MSNSSSSSAVRRISECIINPEDSISDEARQIHYLTPWDLAMLSVDYIQKGLLFEKPPNSTSSTTTAIINQLKNSLSQTLTHFTPLLGRLATKQETNPPSYSVVLDSTKPQGAKFIQAVTDLTVADVMSSNDDVPKFVKSLFAFDVSTVNHEGHTQPLVVVQVTELADGIFIGCSFNHAIADGTCYWHFFNTWAEISRGGNRHNSQCIARPPIIKRWSMDGQDHLINLPYTHHDEFVDKYTPPPLRERIFHFSAQNIAKLKAKANAEANTDKISSFQALSALVWRCITRARGLAVDQKTTCRLATNNRPRLRPVVLNTYFGNCILTVGGSTTAGKLLANNLGWSAWMLHLAVVSHSDEKVRRWIEDWVKKPFIYQTGPFFDGSSIMMGCSPRFDMYDGNDFGFGKAVGVRSGQGNKFDGKVTSYPGMEGGGSVDLEVCLCPEFMESILLDHEFMDVVTKS